MRIMSIIPHFLVYANPQLSYPSRSILLEFRKDSRRSLSRASSRDGNDKFEAVLLNRERLRGRFLLWVWLLVVSGEMLN